MAQPYPCSISIFDVTLTDGQHISTNTTWAPGTEISIAGTVTFDKNVTMSQCTIVMAANAQIVIMPNRHFDASESFILGCQRWNSILVSNKAYINFDNVTIGNGTFGLDFAPGFRQNLTVVTNCTFNDNYAGIRVTAPKFFPSLFFGNHFNPLSTWSDPTATTNHYGMQFVNCGNGCVGCTGANFFDRLLVGIELTNSRLAITDQVFSSMKLVAGEENAGNEIYAEKSHLTVTRCNFSGAGQNGILTEQSTWLQVVYSTFTRNRLYGISTANNAVGTYTNLENNTFNLTYAYGENFFLGNTEAGAIKHERGYWSKRASTRNAIYGNTINVSGTKYGQDMAMINITAPNGGRDHFNIVGNNINAKIGVADGAMPVAKHGIFIRDNSDQISIRRSIISYISQPGQPHLLAPHQNLAIAAEDVDGWSNSIFYNRVTSELFPNDIGQDKQSLVKCAIHVDESTNISVCTNILDRTYRAIHLSGDNGFCDVGQNSIGHHYNGLELRKNATTTNPTSIGQQLWHGNIWNLEQGAYLNMGAVKGDGPSGQKFKIDITPSNGAANHMPPSISPLGWFFQEETGESNTKCPEFIIPPTDILTVAIIPSASDSAIAKHTFLFVNPAHTWDMKRELLGKLMLNPQLMPTGSMFADFYNEEANSSAWKFAKADYLYLSAFAASAALEDDIAAWQLQMNAAMDATCQLNIAQAADPNTIDPVIQQLQDARMAAADSLAALLSTKLGSADNLVDNALLVAKNWNNSLSAVAIYEKNRKSLTRFYIKKASGGLLSDADLAIARSIAYQCPLTGGKAVKSVASLLPAPEANGFLSETAWGEWCSTPLNQSTNDRSLTPLPLQIVPNPASDYFDVWSSSTTQGGQWRLSDMSGRLVQQGAFDADTEKIRVQLAQNVQSGLYFITLIQSTGERGTEKIVIVR